MPRNTYNFPTRDYEVTFLYQKKNYPKQHYYTQVIHIICQPYLISKSRYWADLDVDSRFSNFEDVQDLLKYIRKNKKKDIVNLDQEGYLTILVRGRDRQTEFQSISVVRISHMTEIYDNSEIFYHIQESRKRKSEKRLGKKSKDTVKDIENQAIFFTLNNMVQYQIDKKNPTFEFNTTSQSILEGFKLTVSQMYAQKLVLGISYRDTNKANKVCYWCSFELNSEDDELSIRAKNQLSISVEDNCVFIMNTSNKNGRYFSDSRFDGLEGNQCIVFVSLVIPQI